MIVAEQKPIEEIFEFLKPFGKVLVLGCGTCVTVCSAGGEKEVATLASALGIKSKNEGLGQQFLQKTVERQCDREYIEDLARNIDQYEAVCSMAQGSRSEATS